MVSRYCVNSLLLQELSDKLDTTLMQTIASLTSQLESKERRIVVLEERVNHLESECFEEVT